MVSNHIRAATKQYATLRAAVRALSPAAEVSGGFDLDPRFREIRNWIRHSAGTEHDNAQNRAKIDSALSDLCTEILAIIGRLSFWQIRATLPNVRAESPDDLEALLDVCLSEPDKRWTDLIDYLVTLLATRETDGRKQIERDPASVSPILSEFCAEAVEKATDETAEEAENLAEKIDDARESLARGEPISERVQQIRESKRGSGKLLFVPNVLKSVVAFNVAVHNRTRQHQEVERSLHQAELDVIAETDDAANGGATDQFKLHALPAFGSFELEAVEDALRERLVRGPAQGGPARRIVAAFETSKLGPFEREAFQGSSDDQISRIVRAVVTIGLAVRHRAETSDDIEVLGIDRAWLSRSSAGEIDNLAQMGIRELTRNGQFIEAQQLAELRTRYLNPSFDENLLMRVAVSSEAEAAQVAAEPVRRADTGPSPAQRKRPPTARPRKKARAMKKQSAGGRSGVISAVVAIAVVVAVGALVMTNRDRGGSSSDATPYTVDQLAQVSEYLSSGYTTTDGTLTTFTGTVNQMWARIPTPDKVKEAREVAKSLKNRGVSDVKFFDIGGTLVFHHEAGRTLHLE